MNPVKRPSKGRKGLWVALILALSASLLHLPGSGLFSAEPPNKEKEALEILLPKETDVKGLQGLSRSEFYVPENLFDYMDGQAEAYLAYGFRLLITREYKLGDGSPPIIVEIYRMEGPLHAFGIYAAERSPDDQFIKIGVQGYLGDNALGFWKGPYYVKVISLQTSAATKDALASMGTVISDKIEGSYSEPEIFSAFPENHRVKMSERFIPRNFLGQPFLKNGYRVDYERGGTHYQVFLLKEDSPEEALRAFQRYQAFLQSQDENISLLKKEACPIAFAKGKGGKTFFQCGPFFGGVLNSDDFSLATTLVEQMIQRLKKR
jgi:hypothetical protein